MSDAVDKLLSEAVTHFSARRFAQAAQCYRQVLALHPSHGLAHASLGDIGILTRDAVSAEQHLTAAVAADPSQIKAANNLAVLYRQTGRHHLAHDLLRQTVARAPELADAWFNLGLVLFQLADYDESIVAYETVLRLRPQYAKAMVHLAWSYLRILRLDRCLELLREAKNLDPTPQAHAVLIFYSMFDPGTPAEEIARLAAAYDTRFAAPLRATDKPFVLEAARRDPDRPLRIGYVSPNFRNHSIGHMLEPVLAGHDRSRFIPYCYGDMLNPDAMTERFRSLAHCFRDTMDLSHDKLTELIRQDEIDILVDLNLHMDTPRTRLFARRPSPVQVSYLAYPFTCGLKTMDYRVTDAILDPPGEKPLGPEALIRLRASYWLYRPDPAVPEPREETPARQTGYVTFACLNGSQKLNPAVAVAWASILNRTPGARLLLYAEKPAAQQPHIARLFANAGLDPSRIDLVTSAPRSLYLGNYLQADLCLDPFPYGGHASALDSVWMGVPLVTLAGPAPYSRGATSILSRVGWNELSAGSVEQYQDLAVSLAGDLDRLELLRRGVRERMRASVLCNEASWMADYERGLRIAWQRYCQGLPPAEIDLATS